MPVVSGGVSPGSDSRFSHDSRSHLSAGPLFAPAQPSSGIRNSTPASRTIVRDQAGWRWHHVKIEILFAGAPCWRIRESVQWVVCFSGRKGHPVFHGHRGHSCVLTRFVIVARTLNSHNCPVSRGEIPLSGCYVCRQFVISRNANYKERSIGTAQLHNRTNGEIHERTDCNGIGCGIGREWEVIPSELWPVHIRYGAWSRCRHDTRRPLGWRHRRNRSQPGIRRLQRPAVAVLIVALCQGTHWTASDAAPNRGYRNTASGPRFRPNGFQTSPQH